MLLNRRAAIILILLFAMSVCLFYYSLNKVGWQPPRETQTGHTVENEDTLDEREESLQLPSSSMRGTLVKRNGREKRATDDDIPQVHPNPQDLPSDHNATRPHHPDLSKYTDLPVKEALRQLVLEYLAPWLDPVNPATARPSAPLTQRALSALEWSAKGGAFRVRIVNRRVYFRKLMYWKQTYRTQRMLWYLALLHQMLRDGILPEPTAVDFVVYVGDGPKIAADTFTTDAGFPLFSLRTSLAHVDIPIPDPVSHGSNGQYVWSGSGRAIPWEQRDMKLIFRGRGSCLKMQADNWHVCNRIRAGKLSRDHPELLDIGVIEWNQLWNSRLCDTVTEAEIETNTGVRKVQPMDFDQQSRYRYILDLDGGLGSSRKPGILSSGSVLFAQDSPWFTHWEPLLKPYRHYIPVDKWLRDLKGKVEWARRNDQLMREIQAAGRAFERKFLTLQASKEYLAVLLREYQRLHVDEPITGDSEINIDYCEKMSGSQGAAEIASGPMGCSRGWLEYRGDGSVPEHVINDRAAFESAKDSKPISWYS